MEALGHALTQLALDPFESLFADDSATFTAGERVCTREELVRALEPDPSQARRIAGVDWARCDTCSDPGPDEPDPFPVAPVLDASVRPRPRVECAVRARATSP